MLLPGLTPGQWWYLIFSHLLPAILINFLINFGLGWFFFHPLEQVHLWEELSVKVLPSSISVDLIPTTFFLVLFTGLIVSRQVQGHLRRGRVGPLEPSKLGYPKLLCRIRHPRNPGTNLGLAAAVTLTLVPATILVFQCSGTLMLPLWHFILFKALYAAGLAALFTPLVVLRALAEPPPE